MSINGLGYTPSTAAPSGTSAPEVGKAEKPEGETIRVQVEFGSVQLSTRPRAWDVPAPLVQALERSSQG